MLPLISACSPTIITSPILGCNKLQFREAGGRPVRSLHSTARQKSSYKRRTIPLVSCSSLEDGELGDKEEDDSALNLERQVEKILSDEVLMQDLNAAVDRVAKARRELDALEEQQKEAFISQNMNAANSLVETCQRDVFAAELDLKNAEIALVKARAGMANIMGEEAFDKDVERVESVKAAAVSGAVGSLAGLPFFSLAGNLDAVEVAVSAGIILLSCALFGLTYRYVVRRDLINTQLRAGCIAAFTLVRCLAQVDAIRLFTDISQQGITQQLLQYGLFATESIAVFSFAAVSLEYCFQQGIVSPFPSKPL